MPLKHFKGCWRGCAMVLLATLLLAGCTPKPQAHTTTIFAMNTVMELTAYGPNGSAGVAGATAAINQLERTLSVTRKTSEIYAANHADGGATVLTADTAALLENALELCQFAAGNLDITIYPVVKEWGFTGDAYQVPRQETLDALLPLVDYTAVKLEGDTLTLPQGVQLDLGGVAKGWAGDKAVASLLSAGVESALVNLGGNIHVLGNKPDGTPWTVAIRNPDGESNLGTLTASDEAVVTSGGYQRFFQVDGTTYHHIMNPATGYPAQSDLTSVTVVGKDGLTCDGLSTALYVMGLAGAEDFWRTHGGFEVALYTKDGVLWVTPGLASRFVPGDGIVVEVFHD